MFYVANVIEFSVFLDLLCTFNLLVGYRLNRFWSQQLNQFDTHALLLGGYVSLILLDKMVFYWH